MVLLQMFMALKVYCREILSSDNNKNRFYALSLKEPSKAKGKKIEKIKPIRKSR